ncbi:protein of unknown function [Pseudorhizobium banfieldiae]|uniref:Uncharacterized protein n=1 Tax=Pseudorhizobium banfieldiae TaxID=1125847 RepID=L0NFU2_9HYPH|nr:protein of unknown function [Pseudorhizobium banfieldiae]
MYSSPAARTLAETPTCIFWAPTNDSSSRRAPASTATLRLDPVRINPHLRPGNQLHGRRQTRFAVHEYYTLDGWWINPKFLTKKFKYKL